MFNQGDYRMAKAQQERLLADAKKQGDRRQRSNVFVAVIRRLGLSRTGDGQRRAEKRTAVATGD